MIKKSITKLYLKFAFTSINVTFKPRHYLNHDAFSVTAETCRGINNNEVTLKDIKLDIKAKNQILYSNLDGTKHDSFI